jgi:hypothetical protein
VAKKPYDGSSGFFTSSSSSFPWARLERPSNVEEPAVQVHVIPAQAECFAPPQTERERDGVQRLKPIAPN